MTADAPYESRPDPGDRGALYVTGEDSLRLTSFNSLAGVELALEGRFIDRAGCVKPFSERHVPASDRTATSSLVSLGEGFLGSVMVRAAVGAPVRGQCFVIVEVVRGRLAGLQPLACLLQGYVTSAQRRAWPGTILEWSSDGRGVLRSVAGSDPAAGAEVSEAVPVGARWRLIALTVPFVASAAVANRVPALIIDDGANTLLEMTAAANIVASSNTVITAAAFGAGTSFDPAGINIALPPDLILPGGSRMRTVTRALDAGDNYGAPRLFVEEWIAG